MDSRQRKQERNFPQIDWDAVLEMNDEERKAYLEAHAKQVKADVARRSQEYRHG